MPLMPGVPAPWFSAPSLENPKFNFSSLGGRYVLLAFLPEDEPARAQALAVLSMTSPFFRDDRLVCFAVTRRSTPDSDVDAPKLRWFFDESGEVGRLYGATRPDGGALPHWSLIDPGMRVVLAGGYGDKAALPRIAAGLPDPDEHAGVPLHAPVLIVPRVFEPALCRRLIDHYESVGGLPSGTMRDIDGRTVGVLDDFKRRKDALIEDEAFRAELRTRIANRLLPEIEKAFQFKATRLERYIVACYDADEGGYFRAHRDNTTLGTAHRKFACSINLNAEEFAGGDLRFPEFGRRTYRPPTGGAVVFSCSLLHEATPVTKGTRYAFLPFLYDEEGAQVRSRNSRFLGAPQREDDAEADKAAEPAA
jgi:predicted 2-oxoglutarate/Fe(II)-dependent dioxygenase YbiX/peroxiredoxin